MYKTLNFNNKNKTENYETELFGAVLYNLAENKN